MIKKIAIAATLLFVGSAYANPLLTYNFVDLGFKHTHFDDSAFDNGVGLESKISYSPVEHFFVEGGYEYYNTELQNFDVDGHIFKYGVGAYLPLDCNDAVHLVGRVGGLHIDLNGDYDAAASDDGVYASPEVRWAINDKVETALAAEYQDYSDGGNGWLYRLQGLYALDEKIALDARAGLSDESDVTWLLGLRFAF